MFQQFNLKEDNHSLLKLYNFKIFTPFPNKVFYWCLIAFPQLPHIFFDPIVFWQPSIKISIIPMFPSNHLLFLIFLLFCYFLLSLLVIQDENVGSSLVQVYSLSLILVIISFLFFKKLIIYLFLAVLGLRFCARASSSCGKRGPLFIAVHGPLTIAASLVAEHRLQTRRLSSCGLRA